MKKRHQKNGQKVSPDTTLLQLNLIDVAHIIRLFEMTISNNHQRYSSNDDQVLLDRQQYTMYL
jgi:hypothetical protein